MRDFRRNKPRFGGREADRAGVRFERKDSDRPRPRFGGRDADSSGGRFERKDSDRPRSKFGGRDAGRKTLEFTEVTCDKCGKACRVPFKPTNSKPVYCSDCFKKDGSSEPRGRSDSRTESRSDSGSEAFRQINMKLDKIIHALDLD